MFSPTNRVGGLAFADLLAMRYASCQSFIGNGTR